MFLHNKLHLHCLQPYLSFARYVNLLFELAQVSLPVAGGFSEIWAPSSVLTHSRISPAWVKECVQSPSLPVRWYLVVVLLPKFGVELPAVALGPPVP